MSIDEVAEKIADELRTGEIVLQPEHFQSPILLNNILPKIAHASSRFLLTSERKEAGYEAWKVVNYILQWELISHYKWLMSEEAGHDIGVPETVKRIMDPWYRGINHEVLTDSDYYIFRDTMYDIECDSYRVALIEGYLLGTDFVFSTRPIPDEHGKNQLEGELRRYQAINEGIPKPISVQLDLSIVQDYCAKHRLSPKAPYKFAESLGLIENAASLN